MSFLIAFSTFSVKCWAISFWMRSTTEFALCNHVSISIGIVVKLLLTTIASIAIVATANVITTVVTVVKLLLTINDRMIE